MKIVRVIGIPLVSAVLAIAILAGLISVAVIRTVQSKEDIKLLLAKPSLRQNVATTIKKSLSEDFRLGDSQPSRQTKKADRAAFTKIFDRYFSTDVYNRALNTIVDSLYSWLEGKSSRPTFTLAIVGDKQQFRKFVIDVFSERFKALPVCKSAVGSEYNPIEASCRPASFSTKRARAFITEQSNQPKFTSLYKSTNLTSKQLLGTVDKAMTANAQQAWRAAKIVPWAVWTTIIISTVLLALIVFDKHKSLKIAAIMTLIPSAILLVGALSLKQKTSAIVEALVKQSQADNRINEMVKEIAAGALSLIDNRLLLYSGLLTLTAIGLLIASHWLRPASPVARVEAA